MDEQFCFQNWLAGTAGFNSRSLLLTWPFAIFRVFFRNLHKYRLGSLRKDPPLRALPHRPRSHIRTIGLNLTTQLIECLNIIVFLKLKLFFTLTNKERK